MLARGDRVRIRYPEGGQDWHGRLATVTWVTGTSRWPYKVLVDGPCPHATGVFAEAELEVIGKAAPVMLTDAEIAERIIGTES